MDSFWLSKNFYIIKNFSLVVCDLLEFERFFQDLKAPSSSYKQVTT